MMSQPVSYSEMINRAKRLLVHGWTLRQVAEHMKVSARELDVALWRDLGRRS